MQKCHVNATDALGVSTVVISVKNLFKRFSIREFLSKSNRLRTQPAIIAGS